MSTTSSITYMVIGLAIMIKIFIWCCVLYRRQERRRQLLQNTQTVASVGVLPHGQLQGQSPYGPYPNQPYPPQPYGIDNPVMIGQNPPAYNEIYTNYNEPKLPSYDEVISDPNKFAEEPKPEDTTTSGNTSSNTASADQ